VNSPDGGPGKLSRRQTEIAARLRETGRVAVDELAAHFDVSVQTIRRDLNEMSEARVVTRVHGGAIVASGVTNLAYEARKLVAHPHKRLIGEAAAGLIADGSSLFINIGTTTEEVARALGGRSGLLVVTNNLHVAAELYRNRAIEVVVTGGSVRASDGGVVGASAVEMIQKFRVDTAVIGISAIDPDGTLLDFDIREARVARAIIDNARRVILVSDSSKFARSAPARIGTLTDIDILVTDRLPSRAVGELCRAHEVHVIETGGPQEGEATATDWANVARQ
jgi:DeoR family glycerol-3-phosphate regulon repressor